MRNMGPLARVTAGLLLVVFLSSVGYAGTRIAMGALDEHHTFSVAFGETGQGLVTGADVKVRGVQVGAVGEITLNEDLQAVAELEIEPHYRIPERSQFLITNKTLLGEKQVEVAFEGAIDDGPYIAEGEVISNPDQIVEFENVLGTLAELMEGIDENDLMVVVDDFFGAFDGQGPAIARSVEEGARAAAVFERSLDDQVANNRDLSLVAEELADEGGTFNRLGRATVQGMPTLSENQAEIRRLLGELNTFSRTLNTTFSVNRPDLDRMIVEGDNIIRLLGRYDVEVGQIVSGLLTYTEKFGPGYQGPGIAGQAARFQIILKEDIFSELCVLPEPLRSAIPQCAGEGGDEAQARDRGTRQNHGGAPALPDAPVTLPDALVEPEVPERSGVESLLERTLSGGGVVG